MMICRDAEEKLSGLLDGQLTPEEKVQTEFHLSECLGCREFLSRLKNIDSVLKEHVPTEEASHHLKEKIFERLSLEKIESLLETRVRWQALPRAAVAAALIILTAVFWISRRPPADGMAQAAIVNHINSLSGKLPHEIRDGDPRKIAAWFSGKLPFRIEVPDLTLEGYELVGARLCHLKGLDVAYIGYEKEGREYSLFISDCSRDKFPAKDGETATMAYISGYRAACWRKRESGYIFVSDLPEKELEGLVESIRVRSG